MQSNIQQRREPSIRKIQNKRNLQQRGITRKRATNMWGQYDARPYVKKRKKRVRSFIFPIKAISFPSSTDENTPNTAPKTKQKPQQRQRKMNERRLVSPCCLSKMVDIKFPYSKARSNSNILLEFYARRMLQARETINRKGSNKDATWGRGRNTFHLACYTSSRF